MNEAIIKWLKNLISLIIIAGLAYYLWENWDTFYATFNASWYQIMGLVSCIIMTWLINCLQSFLLYRHAGINIKFGENFIIQIAAMMGNYLPMRLGSLIKMRYFKKVYGLEYIKFVGVAGVRILIILLYCVVLSSIGLIGLKLPQYFLVWILLGIFNTLIIIVIGSSLIKLLYRLKLKNEFIKTKVHEFLTTFEIIRSRPILFCQMSGLVMMQFVTLAYRLSISFDIINVELSPWVLLIIAPTTSLIQFLSLTPGNLGLREWLIGVLAHVSGYNFSSGIFAGSVDRAILMLCTFIMGSGPLVYVWIRATRHTSSKMNGNTAID
jgi:uncharacterized membrane protein YbhN (UPF0104 family)